MKRRAAVLILAIMMLTGCSKKEEDFVLDPGDSYEWSNVEETIPTILREDESEYESTTEPETETETEAETETETEVKRGLSGLQLSGIGSWEIQDPVEAADDSESAEGVGIVLESTPVVVDQANCSHNYEQTGSTKEPTCVKDGYTMYKCTICGKSKSETITATGHDYSEEIIPPTCSTQGYTLQKCSKCGSSSKSNYTALMPHTEKHISIQDPQCIVEGIDEIRCSECNQLLRYENVKVLGHDWETVKEDQPCTEGAVIKYKCKRCGLDRTEKLTGAHKFSSWKVDTAATCKVEGKQSRTCTVCSYQETQTISRLEHKLSDWKVERKATCSAVGEQVKTCSLCGEKVETEEIPKLPHTSNGDWEVTREATCTRAGSEKTTCSVCNQTAEVRVIDKLPHSYRWETVTAATCTAAGLEVQRCSKCMGETNEREIPALGHSYALTNTTDPKCEVAGYKSYKCTRCDETRTEEIPALGHAYNGAGECIRCGIAKQ